MRFEETITSLHLHPEQKHQSGAAEAWWAHNPQVPGSKPGSDMIFLSCFLFYLAPYVFRRITKNSMQSQLSLKDWETNTNGKLITWYGMTTGLHCKCSQISPLIFCCKYMHGNFMCHKSRAHMTVKCTMMLADGVEWMFLYDNKHHTLQLYRYQSCHL